MKSMIRNDCSRAPTETSPTWRHRTARHQKTFWKNCAKTTWTQGNKIQIPRVWIPVERSCEVTSLSQILRSSRRSVCRRHTSCHRLTLSYPNEQIRAKTMQNRSDRNSTPRKKNLGVPRSATTRKNRNERHPELIATKTFCNNRTARELILRVQSFEVTTSSHDQRKRSLTRRTPSEQNFEEPMMNQSESNPKLTMKHLIAPYQIVKPTIPTGRMNAELRRSRRTHN